MNMKEKSVNNLLNLAEKRSKLHDLEAEIATIEYSEKKTHNLVNDYSYKIRQLEKELEVAHDTKVFRSRRQDSLDFNFERNNDMLDSIPTQDNLSDARLRGTGLTITDEKKGGRDLSNCKIL
jgi:hypothetical protein